MVQYFQHRCQIALFLKNPGVHINEIKQFIGIYQVKISCQCQVFSRHQIAFDKGVTKFYIILTLGTIT